VEFQGVIFSTLLSSYFTEPIIENGISRKRGQGKQPIIEDGKSESGRQGKLLDFQPMHPLLQQ